MRRLPPGRRLTWAGRASLLVLAWAGLAGLLIAVGEGVVHSSTLTAMDRNITSFVVSHRTPALNAVMKGLTWMGSWVALLVTTGLIVALSARRHIPRIAVPFVIVAWAGELGAVTLAKDLVHRQRPPADLWLVSAHGQSFPSGHTANALVVCATVALLTAFSVRSTPAKVSIWAVAILAMVAVGFSRIELGVHWTTDVIASALFVTGWLMIVGAWLRRVKTSPGETHIDNLVT